MLKIFLSVRNRLGITKKCIESIEHNTTEPYQIFVYDNLTNYRLDDHIEYFGNLYKEGRITQVTFNSKDSTFNAFSKAVSSNMFGLQHEQDPDKDKTEHLMILDNDVIIVHKKFDKMLRKCWQNVKKKKLNNVKIIGQKPGGIKGCKTVIEGGLSGIEARIGKLGGSGMWSVRSDFYRDVGFLDLKRLQGQNKRHDQMYWQKCEKASQGQPYIIALNTKIGIHCGKVAGSICNPLSKMNSNEVLEKIKWSKADKEIEAMSYDNFINMIMKDKYLANDW